GHLRHNWDMSTSAEPLPGASCESVSPELEIERLRAEVQILRDDRQRAECMAAIQSEAVELALGLLVTHPDLRGCFRMFIKRLGEDSDSHACGVWLLDEETGRVDLWMANLGGETLTADSPRWAALAMPRESMSWHLGQCDACQGILEYDGDDERLP